MKRFSVRLGVIFVGLAILGYAEVWGADWKWYGKSDLEDRYYDAESITHPSKDVVRVWGKGIPTEKGVINYVEKLDEKYKTLSYSLQLDEYHCAEKKWRMLHITEYSTDEGILGSGDNHNPTWNFIIPESVGDDLYKILCE